jgi:hypothetical protein
MFFNLALDNILHKDPITRRLIERKRLLAYADDLVVLIEENSNEAIKVI